MTNMTNNFDLLKVSKMAYNLDLLKVSKHCLLVEQPFKKQPYFSTKKQII